MSEADPRFPKVKGDLFSKFDALIEQRETLLATGVRDPFSLVMEQVLSPTRAVVNGKETILLGTYNYMGMTFDDDVIQAGKDALDTFGAGTTGSRVPALTVWFAVIGFSVGVIGSNTGASLTAVTVMLAVSVAVLNALLPPLVELSTLLPAAPLLWSQAR